jgi:hypothetical protein
LILARKSARHLRFIKPTIDLLSSLPEIRLALATHGLLHKPCWQVPYPATVLVLVPMLAAATRPTEPFDLEVGLAPLFPLD